MTSPTFRFQDAKKYVGALAIAALLPFTVACSSTRPVSDQVSDSAITTKITSKLAADPEINPFRIDVDTNEGRVTLRGSVEKDGAREEAEKHARATKGVVSVDNRIEVVPSGESRMLSDAAITTKVKARLTADPELNPFNIDVDTRNGAVTLTGRVRTQAARAEAEKLARGTQGVKSVANELEVVDG